MYLINSHKTLQIDDSSDKKKAIFTTDEWNGNSESEQLRSLVSPSCDAQSNFGSPDPLKQRHKCVLASQSPSHRTGVFDTDTVAHISYSSETTDTFPRTHNEERDSFDQTSPHLHVEPFDQRLLQATFLEDDFVSDSDIFYDAQEEQTKGYSECVTSAYSNSDNAYKVISSSSSQIDGTRIVLDQEQCSLKENSDSSPCSDVGLTEGTQSHGCKVIDCTYDKDKHLVSPPTVMACEIIESKGQAVVRPTTLTLEFDNWEDVSVKQPLVSSVWSPSCQNPVSLKEELNAAMSIDVIEKTSEIIAENISTSETKAIGPVDSVDDHDVKKDFTSQENSDSSERFSKILTQPMLSPPEDDPGFPATEGRDMSAPQSETGHALSTEYLSTEVQEVLSKENMIEDMNKSDVVDDGLKVENIENELGGKHEGTPSSEDKVKHIEVPQTVHSDASQHLYPVTIEVKADEMTNQDRGVIGTAEIDKNCPLERKNSTTESMETMVCSNATSSYTALPCKTFSSRPEHSGQGFVDDSQDKLTENVVVSAAMSDQSSRCRDEIHSNSTPNEGAPFVKVFGDGSDTFTEVLENSDEEIGRKQGRTDSAIDSVVDPENTCLIMEGEVDQSVQERLTAPTTLVNPTAIALPSNSTHAAITSPQRPCIEGVTKSLNVDEEFLDMSGMTADRKSSAAKSSPSAHFSEEYLCVNKEIALYSEKFPNEEPVVFYTTLERLPPRVCLQDKGEGHIVENIPAPGDAEGMDDAFFSTSALVTQDVLRLPCTASLSQTVKSCPEVISTKISFSSSPALPTAADEKCMRPVTLSDTGHISQVEHGSCRSQEKTDGLQSAFRDCDAGPYHSDERNLDTSEFACPSSTDEGSAVSVNDGGMDLDRPDPRAKITTEKLISVDSTSLAYSETPTKPKTENEEQTYQDGHTLCSPECVPSLVKIAKEEVEESVQDIPAISSTEQEMENRASEEIHPMKEDCPSNTHSDDTVLCEICGIPVDAEEDTDLDIILDNSVGSENRKMIIGEASFTASEEHKEKDDFHKSSWIEKDSAEEVRNVPQDQHVGSAHGQEKEVNEETQSSDENNRGVQKRSYSPALQTAPTKPSVDIQVFPNRIHTDQASDLCEIDLTSTSVESERVNISEDNDILNVSLKVTPSEGALQGHKVNVIDKTDPVEMPYSSSKEHPEIHQTGVSTDLLEWNTDAQTGASTDLQECNTDAQTGVSTDLLECNTDAQTGASTDLQECNTDAQTGISTDLLECNTDAQTGASTDLQECNTDAQTGVTTDLLECNTDAQTGASTDLLECNTDAQTGISTDLIECNTDAQTGACTDLQECNTDAQTGISTDLQECNSDAQTGASTDLQECSTDAQTDASTDLLECNIDAHTGAPTDLLEYNTDAQTGVSTDLLECNTDAQTGASTDLQECNTDAQTGVSTDLLECNTDAQTGASTDLQECNTDAQAGISTDLQECNTDAQTGASTDLQECNNDAQTGASTDLLECNIDAQTGAPTDLLECNTDAQTGASTDLLECNTDAQTGTSTDLLECNTDAQTGACTDLQECNTDAQTGISTDLQECNSDAQPGASTDLQECNTDAQTGASTDLLECNTDAQTGAPTDLLEYNTDAQTGVPTDLLECNTDAQTGASTDLLECNTNAQTGASTDLLECNTDAQTGASTDLQECNTDAQTGISTDLLECNTDAQTGASTDLQGVTPMPRQVYLQTC